MSVLLVAVLFSSCLKNTAEMQAVRVDAVVKTAQRFFMDSIAPAGYGRTGEGNPRLSTSKELLWDKATVVSNAAGQCVVVPVKYLKPLFVSPDFAGGALYSLDAINKIVFFKDQNNRYQCQSMTLFPDSTFFNQNSGSFSGVIFVETYAGSPINKFKYGAGGSILKYQPGLVSAKPKALDGTKGVDVIISVCSQINGYNYSPEAPDDGYSWSEPAGCQESYFPTPIGVGAPVGPPSGLLAPLTGVRLAIIVNGGTRPIANISQYFGCFTSGSSPSQTYGVQVCVDQPVPGTRQAWGFTNEGLGSSLVGNNPVDVGHTFIILTENNGGTIITRNVGFYPTGFVSPTPASYATTQGMLNDDEDHGYNISLTINNLSSTQFSGILSALSLGNNQGYSYDINSDNCTTMILTALNNNGISLPMTQGSWPGGGGLDPGDLGEDIRQMTLGPNMSRSTVSSAHPNTGSCQ